MRRLVLMLVLMTASAAGSELPGVPIIAYHDVRDSVAGDYDRDQFAVSTANLIEQFSWLQQAGYQPISVEQLIAALEGRATLPEQPVLLSFDDGYASVYSRVFPLLKQFRYPAVVSVVTSWIDGTSSAGVPAGTDFLTWPQIREMQASDLIEIASHSHDLHRGVTGNPQGNQQPAAVTRRLTDGRYEGEAEYRARVRADLDLSTRRIKEETGHAPKVITWPFGAFNDLAASESAKLGMKISFTLEPRSFEKHGVMHFGRKLVSANPGLANFSAMLTLEERPPIVRVAQIDLDYVYDESVAQQERNLDRLLDRIKALNISHVFLQAFSDVDADGGAQTLYFPNRHLPLRADLFNRVAWQLKTRADVRVFAWMPMLSFDGDAFDEKWRVQQLKDGVISTDSYSEPRLSPFSTGARQLISEIYEDLAVSARFDGLLFHDDGRLSDLEDFSVVARDAYRREFGEDFSAALLAEDHSLRRSFGRFKTQALLEFSRELTEIVRRHQPAIQTARNMFASALLDETAPGYLAQDYDEFLAAYDFVALMAMPRLESAGDDKSFYEALVHAVGRRDNGFERTIFELQTIDWSTARRLDSRKLKTTMRWLQSRGVRNIGYYPDDFIAGHPDLWQLRQGMSLADGVVEGTL